ncbi:MAG: ferritin family protein [Deltaproteobacteria bacterium]|nr:ferritin family protein [Deltaproteobacteria bacterium]
MSILFSASEVMTIAIQIEKNGLNFYNAMAAKSENKEAKELFKFLADEEVKHYSTFQKLLNGLKKLEISAYDQEEYNNYLGALTSSRVFNRDANTAEFVKDLTDLDAVEIAIEAEKDSILFYYELLEQAFSEDKNEIEKVIKEEKIHYAKLIKLKKDLSAG